MRNFIKALYADLLHRIDVVLNDIESSQHHDDIKDRFIKDTLIQFERIKQELRSQVDTGALDFDDLRGNNLYLFNKKNREFNSVHSYRYLAIKNYDKPEIFFFRLITQIYSEHRINALPPIVSTISNHDSYYWAVPYFEIIALPSGEENSLLNLPDMYHEIGHLLHSMFEGASYERSLITIDKYFQTELVRVEDEGIDNHFLAPIEQARVLWQNSWLEEFSCDLVGTYMSGPAYAWTNLKLLSTGHASSKIFEYSESHPADEARMVIILMMLDKLGLTDDKQKIEEAWNIFLRDTEPYRSAIHRLVFPDKILRAIVDEFYEFYQNADLASYPEIRETTDSSIAKILNDAWTNAQEQPDNYYNYENEVIHVLKKKFDINPPQETIKITAVGVPLE